ncbi:lysine transporter LysE [Actinocatenispora thailandica]|uniref:Lysine transporter LysE n=1 Tax=Actinocatenispora thailandica TaxID=227318 RepID=A0A7R7DK86_9ACTN|nr:LysE family transporter [Actinocatenispora thailandica]BCJ33065.1 lysine transporter LysE [Actinocatenispora thailandica]
MTGALVAGLLAGYGIAIPIGAVGAYLVTLSATAGPRVAAAAALGIATVDGLYAAAAVLGGAALAGRITPYAGIAHRLAALVVLLVAGWLVVGAVRRYRRHATSTAAGGTALTPVRAYAVLLAMTLLNPTTLVYFGAVVVGGQAGGLGGPVAGAVFVVAAFLASASWQLLLSASGLLLGRLLTGRRGRLATTLVAAVVVVALAIRLALS